MKGEDVGCLCKAMAHWMDKEGRRFLDERLHILDWIYPSILRHEWQIWTGKWNSLGMKSLTTNSDTLKSYSSICRTVYCCFLGVSRFRNLARPALNLEENLEDFVGACSPLQSRVFAPKSAPLQARICPCGAGRRRTLQGESRGEIKGCSKSR